MTGLAVFILALGAVILTYANAHETARHYRRRNEDV